MATTGAGAVVSISKNLATELKLSSKITNTSIKIANFTNKNIKILNNKYSVWLKKLGDKVGINGRQIETLASSLDESEFTELVGKVENATKKEILGKYRTLAKTCGLTPNSTNLCSIPTEIAKQILESNGNPTKTLKYLVKNGKLSWLEEGVAVGDKANDFGFNHIIDRHHPDGKRLAGAGTQFPNISLDKLQNIIFDIIKTTNSTTSDGNLKYVKNITFSNGQVAPVRVITTKSGNILTSYPEKIPK